MSTVKDLIIQGLVEPGEILIWSRRQAKVTFEAKVNSDGTLTTNDGVVHKSLSGAAKHLNGNKPIDGWNVWKQKKSNMNLAQLREKLKL